MPARPPWTILSALQGNGIQREAQRRSRTGPSAIPISRPDRIPGELRARHRHRGGRASSGLRRAPGFSRSVREQDGRACTPTSRSHSPWPLRSLSQPPSPKSPFCWPAGRTSSGPATWTLASGGFAVLLGGLAAMAGPRLAAVGVGGLLAVFAVGTVKSLDSAYTIADFHAAAAFIDRSAAQRRCRRGHGVDAVLAGPDHPDRGSDVRRPAPLQPLPAHRAAAVPERRLRRPLRS